jgi:chromosome segregation ATPase
LSIKVEDIGAERDTLRQRAVDEEKAKSDAESSLRVLKEQHDALQARSEQLQHRKEELEALLAGAAAETAEAREQGHERERQVHAAEEKLIRVRAEMREVQDALRAAVEAAEEDRTHAWAREADLKAEISSARAETALVRADAENNVTSASEARERAVARAQASEEAVLALEKRLAKTEQDLRVCNQQMDVAHEHRVQAENAAASAMARVERLEQVLEDCRGQLACATGELEESVAGGQRLRSSVSEARREAAEAVETAHAWKAEADELERALVASRRQMKDIQDQLDHTRMVVRLLADEGKKDNRTSAALLGEDVVGTPQRSSASSVNVPKTPWLDRALAAAQETKQWLYTTSPQPKQQSHHLPNTDEDSDNAL